MFHEHSHVALVRPLPALQLEPGDVGVVIYVHEPGVAYDVEFMTPDGRTIDVKTLQVHDLCIAPKAAPRLIDATGPGLHTSTGTLSSLARILSKVVDMLLHPAQAALPSPSELTRTNACVLCTTAVWWIAE